MSVTNILPVLLCGGSGTRLWPLSRKAFPKQFVPLINGKSLLQLTLERVKHISPQMQTVASDEHRFLVQEAAEAAGVSARHILEPVGRNTAPAMAVAALNAQPDQLLLFAPADHHIPDAQAFAATIQKGVPSAQAGYIVTFGVLPTFPSTAYGYIKVVNHDPRSTNNDQRSILFNTRSTGTNHEPPVFNVARFIEKPDADSARQLLLAGGHYWNAGIFLAKASTIIMALEQHAPDILTACRLATAQQTEDGLFIRLDPEAFAACPSDSIDYAVLEHHDKVAMVPFTGQWSDVGSWNAVAELTPADEMANRIHGQGRAVQANNTYIHAPHRPVVALGTRDLLIIDSPDALLVAACSHAELVKTVVAELEATGAPQATQHRRAARPWGAYDCVDVGERFQVKRITVKPGAKLSLQMHHHRAEHWIVVKGTAKVTRGEETFLLSENQSTYISLGTAHRLENPGKTPLEMIEVQSGSYLGEDDIVRFEDNYGRSK
ncbi:MAG: mannose-1-phosphate guanylyltransferase/mannose-6-phosphate isomerase [Burkholderiales bacterium]|nr:mannose-1-phosphate guanylyltransferase/mannose-6-phosphate isomerase [Burkholderiales bacterium]